MLEIDKAGKPGAKMDRKPSNNNEPLGMKNMCQLNSGCEEAKDILCKALRADHVLGKKG